MLEFLHISDASLELVSALLLALKEVFYPRTKRTRNSWQPNRQVGNGDSWRAGSVVPRACLRVEGRPRLRLGRGGFAHRCRRTRASAALLRFKLRRWDRSFLAQHGRKATHEDRKLDRGYQELRARLRAVDTEHEREKDRVPLKPQRCLSPMASTRRSSAARATAGGATAGDTTRRTGHTDDSGTRMPNLAEKEKMETFLAGVQAHVATNHNRAFLAAALGAEIAQTTMEYNPENLFGFDSRPALPHYVQDGALRRRAELRQDRHAVYHNMSKRCEMAEREAARAAKEAELRAFIAPAVVRFHAAGVDSWRNTALFCGGLRPRLFAAASRRASGTPIASRRSSSRRQRRLRHAAAASRLSRTCRHAWWRRLRPAEQRAAAARRRPRLVSFAAALADQILAAARRRKAAAARPAATSTRSARSIRGRTESAPPPVDLERLR